VKVNQALCAAGPVDAVTGQALAYRALFDEWGWGGRDCADRTAGGIDRRTVRPLRTLEESPADALVLHYSGYAPHIERVLALPYPTLLVSHNITPARWFWRYQPTEGVHCTLGREQLAELAAAADVAAGVSEFNARELRAAGADASVIPILFDREALGAPGPQPPPGPPTILFVGRLEPRKGAAYLVRAYAKLKARYPEIRLIVCGRGPEQSDLRAFVREEQVTDVLFAGQVSEIDKARFYKTADIFCAPSTGQESFGIVLLEAMAAGTAAVASDIHGYKKVIQRNVSGLLVEPRDVDGLCSTLERLVTEPALRERLGVAGSARAREFDWPHVTDQLLAFYDEVIDAKRA